MVKVNLIEVKESRGLFLIKAEVDGVLIDTKLKMSSYGTKEKIAQSIARSFGKSRTDLQGEVEV